jgi:hypothetical protein
MEFQTAFLIILIILGILHWLQIATTFARLVELQKDIVEARLQLSSVRMSSQITRTAVDTVEGKLDLIIEAIGEDPSDETEPGRRELPV